MGLADVLVRSMVQHLCTGSLCGVKSDRINVDLDGLRVLLAAPNTMAGRITCTGVKVLLHIVLPIVLLFAVVPEGYFLQGPGLVTPCPQGEYKSDSSSSSTKTNCTKCSVGVTTARNASTSEADCKGE